MPGDGKEPSVQIAVGVARLTQESPGHGGEHISVTDTNQIPQEAALPSQGEQSRLHPAMELSGQRAGFLEDQAGVTGVPLEKKKDSLSKQADQDNTGKKKWDNFHLSDLEQTVTQGYSSR